MGQTSKGNPRFTHGQKWTWAVVVTLLLFLALGNLGRGVMALHIRAALPSLPLTVPLEYLAAMGFFWAAAFAACVVGLWRLSPWGRRVTPIAVTLYQAHVWLNHLCFDASDYARQTRPFDLLMTLLCLALVWGGLWVLSRERQPAVVEKGA
jgi:hypothetical protein